ncbi:MAG: hypothetical protein LQ339_007736 [Xanthoria mediterranea]|nr:MAG: hypothetical protein LQ339_007736 [Xanthoria mediterranea]
MRDLLIPFLIGGRAYAHAAGPLAVSVGKRSSPNIFKEWFPPDSPERPWNDHICRKSLVADVHLTFEYDDPVPQGRLMGVINKARTELREWIDADIPQGLRPGTMIIWPAGGFDGRIQPGDVLLSVQPVDRVYPSYATHEIQYSDVLKAVDLLEWCSVAQGYIEGIYAYIYVQGRHMGYMWTKRYDPRSPDLQDATTNA